jgi:hypothetical protein
MAIPTSGIARSERNNQRGIIQGGVRVALK